MAFAHEGTSRNSVDLKQNRASFGENSTNIKLLQ